ncbi:MAG: guanylate kinase [Patescibacteria group bacterium]|nr:guanylate kinase [Patescibacteria group bacterium]
MRKTIFNNKKLGILIVITGASGAGKDAVMDEFLKDPRLSGLNLKKVVTCTNRPPRPGETDGVQYHFLEDAKLRQMEAKGELVEEITTTGTSAKATPKCEIERLLKGENLVWRIDPSRAAEVATGNFFKRVFPQHVDLLQPRTMVLFITAPKEVIEERRRRRDLDKYNPAEYEARDSQEKPYLEILEKSAVSIENLDGRLNEAASAAVNSVINFYNNVKA